MAVHMSKKLLEKENNISSFIKNIIKTQEREIEVLKINYCGLDESVKQKFTCSVNDKSC
jgi:uncharacterized protein (DUF305 family)